MFSKKNEGKWVEDRENIVGRLDTLGQSISSLLGVVSRLTEDVEECKNLMRKKENTHSDNHPRGSRVLHSDTTEKKKELSK